MMYQIVPAAVWWRAVQLGEFYNIERIPQLSSGGGGSLYIEIPSSMVSDTLRFLGVVNDSDGSSVSKTVYAKNWANLSEGAEITFKTKSGNRLRIASQNRQQPNTERHPVWTETYGFPKAPDAVASKSEAASYFPDGGLRIYLIKDVDGNFYAGFTQGARPAGMSADDPNTFLYPSSPRTPGGVVEYI